MHERARLSPLIYWLIGALLFWLMLPTHLFDNLAAPMWHGRIEAVTAWVWFAQQRRLPRCPLQVLPSWLWGC